MKLERIALSTRMIEKLGFKRFFNHVCLIEILDNFQYSKNYFLSLERITFKPDQIENWKDIMKEEFPVKLISLISRDGDSVTCIVESISEMGFFPPEIAKIGSWAIIPPIIIDEKLVKFTLLSDDARISEIHDLLSTFDPDFQVLASRFLRNSLSQIGLPFPDFTQRQKEIATYAVRKGFYESPKRISALEISRHFNISESAVNEHLRKARKLAMEYFFG
ncbi:MAG: helix-turn-helix domain-containing protein [Promethearchaeota archaeon]